MVHEVMLYTSNDLRGFMHLTYVSPLGIEVYAMDGQTADRGSMLGLMIMDYRKPVKVISEDKEFLEQLDRWTADRDIQKYSRNRHVQVSGNADWDSLIYEISAHGKNAAEKSQKKC